MVLEKESETYKTQLPSLVTEEGKFALILETALVGVYGTYDEATLKDDYIKFQLKPFMVKQIRAIKQMQFISRTLSGRTRRIRSDAQRIGPHKKRLVEQNAQLRVILIADRRRKKKLPVEDGS